MKRTTKELLFITTALVFTSIVTFCITNAIVSSRFEARQPKFSSISEVPHIEYVNKIRAAHGQPALVVDEGLNQSAAAKVRDIISRDYWSHDTPTGEPFYSLIQRVRPGLKHMGENLAQCFTSNQAAFDGWSASPGHLENMIEPDYTLFGSYTEYDPATKCFVTANHFGRE